MGYHSYPVGLSAYLPARSARHPLLYTSCTTHPAQGGPFPSCSRSPLRSCPSSLPHILCADLTFTKVCPISPSVYSALHHLCIPCPIVLPCCTPDLTFPALQPLPYTFPCLSPGLAQAAAAGPAIRHCIPSSRTGGALTSTVFFPTQLFFNQSVPIQSISA